MTEKAEKPAKSGVELVWTVPTQNASRGDKFTVDAETADRLVANGQAREV